MAITINIRTRVPLPQIPHSATRNLQLGRLVLTSSVPSTIPLFTIPEDGGYRLPITGATGIPDGSYNVHLGPLGSALDPVCYSGVSGRGNTVVVAGGVFLVVSPILPIGGPYEFTLVPILGGTTHVTAPVVTVVHRNYRSRVYSLRRSLAPRWAVGAKKVGEEA